MKAAAPPSVRVEPALRAQTEQVPHAGVTGRLMQREFVARGLAALERAREHDDYVTADECVARLREKLESARGATVRPAAGDP